MKIITRNSVCKILLIFCFFILGSTYSQSKKTTEKTLFGKTVKQASINPKNGKIRCATNEYEKYLQEKNPNRLSETQFETWLAPLVSRQKAMKTSSQSGGIITIPVVVHVIYNGQAVGIATNITDTQVQSQITVLNEDFRKMAGTPGSNTNPIGADTQIQFALAQVDPNGNPTNGIDRVSLCQDSWSEDQMNNSIKPSTIWDPNQYMNMWTIQFSDTDLLGYAQFPDGSSLGGLDANGGPANSDGVVANYNVFGSKTFDDGTFLLGTTYDKGRTMTHEVGHWLGLRHIWGDGNGDEVKNSPDCSATDYCTDTPQAGWEHYTCGTFDTCPSSPGNDMPQNYMDYTNDVCMNIFTQDQKTRITTIINNAARRSSLKTSTKDSPISLFANDAELKLEANCDIPTCGVSTNQTIQKIIIYNRGINNLTSATINYNINGGSNNVYNWTGNLATNKFSVISITINATASGTINAAVANANGGSDQRTTNNNASGTFIIQTTPPSYAFTDYIFRLQLDLWGSECTWNIKDDSGNTFYSGGPYTDKKNLPLPSLITENWTLVSGKCYTFTINDSQGDGICCGDGGDGYYDIKSTDATVITSGTKFYTSKIAIFSTDTLSTNEFEKFNEIYLYPNPTKNVLNILVSGKSALPNSYSISNSLGQNIIRKEVSKEADLIINTSALSNGVYFITLTKADQKRTLKFIKE